MAATAAGQRPYQVVVYGATSFTGKLVCEHIARDYQGRIRWAMAGRDQRRLEGVREELAKINPSVKDVPILTADAKDPAAVGSVLKQSQVVLTTTGPFALYGDNVVSQAVEQGTHYCDITGELPWVKRTVEKFHQKAVEKGVKIVHCCGYDSIPSDLGTLMLVDYCRNKLKQGVSQAYTLVAGAKGGVSGGTVASALNIVQTEGSELGKMATDQYYLAAAYGGKRGSDKPAPYTPTKLDIPGVWAGPFIMEGVNAKIVQASNALAPKGPYGKDFKYREMVQGGKGWAGFATASAISLGMAGLGVGYALPPTRWLLTKVLPAPGSGPSREAQLNGYWTHRVVAVTEDNRIVNGTVGDKRDAGYWSTSRMLLESGLALALDNDKINASGECRSAGVLTPATGMGMVLVDRLRAAGFTFKIDE